MNIQFSTSTLFTQFSGEDMKNQEVATLVSYLYTKASEYEDCQRNMIRFGEQIQDSLERILKGETPWYDITVKAIELDREAAKAKAAKEAFKMAVKLGGHTLIEG